MGDTKACRRKPESAHAGTGIDKIPDRGFAYMLLDRADLGISGSRELNMDPGLLLVDDEGS